MSTFVLAAFLVSLLTASGWAAIGGALTWLSHTCFLKIIPKTKQIAVPIFS